MDIREIKNFLIIAVTNAVRDIQQTIFKVEIENQIEIPKEIEIKNLKEIQKVSGKVEVEKIDEVIDNLKKIKEKEIKFPKQLEEIKIKNFDKLINKKEKDIIIPDRVKIENLDGIIKILEEIKNKKIPEPKDIKIPDTIKISNLKDIPKTDEVSIKNLNQLLDALGNMNFTSYDPARPIAVRLSDGKYFYKALTEIVDRVVSGGGASNVGLRNEDNERINPATEDTLSAINEKVITYNEHIKTLGFHESIGHLSTNTDIVVERAMGKKTGIGTGAFTLLEEAAFVQPSGDTQMYIESASTDDDDGGSGANIITIEYFSLAWGQKKTVTVTMNGTAQVALSVADIYRIHKMYINKGGNAAGLIKLTNQAEDVLYGQISQYHAFMQRCIFYVAEGERVTCTEAMLSSYSKEGVIGRVFASEEDASGNVVPRARVICEIVTTALPCPFVISESVSNPNNKRIAMGLAVTGVAAAQNATGTIKGFSKPE